MDLVFRPQPSQEPIRFFSKTKTTIALASRKNFESNASAALPCNFFYQTFKYWLGFSAAAYAQSIYDLSKKSRIGLHWPTARTNAFAALHLRFFNKNFGFGLGFSPISTAQAHMWFLGIHRSCHFCGDESQELLGQLLCSFPSELFRKKLGNLGFDFHLHPPELRIWFFGCFKSTFALVSQIKLWE